MILTRVTKDNAYAFSSLSPGGSIPDKDLTSGFVIGALMEEGNGVIPAGLLIFRLESPFIIKKKSESPVLRLLWIYTEERFRGKNTGRTLMEKMIALAGDAGVNEIHITLKDNPDQASLQSFFEHFGFSFSDSEELQLNVPVGNIMHSTYFEKHTNDDSIKSLQEIPVSKQETFLENCGVDIGSLFSSPYRHPDYDLSSVILKDGKIQGMFIIAINDKGNGREYIDPVFLKVLPGVSPLRIYSLIWFPFNRANEFYGPSIPVKLNTFNPYSVKLVNYLKHDCPTKKIKTGIKLLR